MTGGVGECVLAALFMFGFPTVIPLNAEEGPVRQCR